jgi:hypothetical protein
MNSPLVQCPKCRGFLLEGVFNRQDLVPCPSCETPLEIEVFPAFFRRINPGKSGEALLVEGESSCFYHPEKKAVIPCGGCGRFLCALCDCELNGQHLCPTCLETGRTKGKIKSLENRRVRYDSIALATALYPMVLVFTAYFTFITAPIAVFIAIRYWNSPLSIVRQSKIRYVVAIIIAGLQITGWVILVVTLLNRRHG